jgi:excinuclease ABC subunit B
MAQVLARVNRPTLVMAHNKTLAAQLYQEFKRFFPENAVEYFVSYYDYYQPKPTFRHRLVHREGSDDQRRDRPHAPLRDALAVRTSRRHHRRQRVVYLWPRIAEAYYGLLLPLEVGQRIDRDQILRKLVEIQYERNDTEFGRGTSAFAATSSRWCRRTKNTRCGSVCSATRWTSWPGSIPSPEKSFAVSTRWRCTRSRTS